MYLNPGRIYWAGYFQFIRFLEKSIYDIGDITIITWLIYITRAKHYGAKWMSFECYSELRLTKQY